MDVFYTIIKAITLPGAILKGFFEHLTCKILKIPVDNNNYLQTNELFGHVEHALVKGKNSFAVCFLPFLLSLLTGLAITTPATVFIYFINKSGYIGILADISLYLGLSVLINLFPLIEDSLSMWENLYGKGSDATMVSKIVLAPLALIMLCGSYLERYGITILTSLIFAYFLPDLFSALIV